MTIIEYGKILGGGITLSHPVALPEGTEVVVAISALKPSAKKPSPEEIEEVMSRPFFGMWADREDMADSDTWMRKSREQWLDRLNREG